MTDDDYKALVVRVALAMHDEDCEHPWPKYSEWYKSLATAALSALGLRELVEALETFARFAEIAVEDGGWKTQVHQHEICLWFTATEFDAARTALARLKQAAGDSGEDGEVK